MSTGCGSQLPTIEEDVMFQRLRPSLLATALALAITSASHAAPPQGTTSSSSSSSPYAGEERRDIKALSAQEVQALLGGRGMGFAKAAELNGYPGPAHVLELGGELSLSAEQRRRTEALFVAMEREAIVLGKALVAAELEVDRLFAGGTVTAQSLEPALARAGELQAKLRGVHLQAHIEQAQILDAAQVERYSLLRGYRGDGGQGAHAAHHGQGSTTGHRPGRHP
jgi:hypothetical protein